MAADNGNEISESGMLDAEQTIAEEIVMEKPKKRIEQEEDYMKELIRKNLIKESYKKYGLTLLYSLLDDEMISYELALGIKPQTAEDFYNHGVFYANKNNLQQAIKHFLKSIEIDKDFSAAYYNLGLAYKAAKDTRQAKKELQEFISLEEKELKSGAKNKSSKEEIDWIKEAKKQLNEL